MPHVSKKLLEKTKFSDIHYDLFKTIAELSGSGNAKAVLNELFTKTEKQTDIRLKFLLHINTESLKRKCDGLLRLPT